MVVKRNLVFLPPMGHTADFYHPLRRELEAEFDLHFLNYPVFGKVEGDEILRRYIQHFCSEIRDINGPLILCGLSLGATLSLKIKDELGEKIEKLILMASGGLRVARARKEMIEFHIDNCVETPELFIRKALSLESLDSFLGHFCSPDENARRYFNDYFVDSWHGKYSSPKANELLQTAREAVNINYEESLQRHQSSIFFLWGMKDRVFSLRHLRKFKNLIPSARFYELESTGHYLPLERPKECARIIREACDH